MILVKAAQWSEAILLQPQIRIGPKKQENAMGIKFH